MPSFDKTLNKEVKSPVIEREEAIKGGRSKKPHNVEFESRMVLPRTHQRCVFFCDDGVFLSSLSEKEREREDAI